MSETADRDLLALVESRRGDHQAAAAELAAIVFEVVPGHRLGPVLTEFGGVPVISDTSAIFTGPLYRIVLVTGAGRR